MVAGGDPANDAGKVACEGIGRPELVIGACRGSGACKPPAGASGGNDEV